MKIGKRNGMLAILLVFSLVSNIFAYPVTGYAVETDKQQVVYVEGVKFIYKTDANGRITRD